MSDRAETPQASLYGDADPQRKLSLLKKAVISLTKQKQELEANNVALTEKLTQLGETLGEAHDTENQLRRELATVTNELQSFKAMAANASTHASIGGRVGAGVASIKGLFGNAAGDAGGAATSIPSARAAAPRNTGSSSAPLSQEGQERMFEENEALHMQLFEVRTGHAAAMKSAEETRRQLEAKVAALEVDNRRHVEHQSEQAKELATVHGELDGLRASDLFCKTFLCIDTLGDLPSREGASPTALVVRPVQLLTKAEIAPSLSHSASWRINRLFEAVEQLVSSIGAAIVAVKAMWLDREAAPSAAGAAGSRTRGASHEVRQLRTLQSLFAAKTNDLTHHLKALTEMCVREAADHAHFTHLELSVMQAAEACVAVLLPYVAMLIEGSIPLGARTSQYPLPISVVPRAREGLGTGRTVSVSRDVAVDSLVETLVRDLSSSRATLSLLQSLVAKRQSKNLLPSHVPSWSCMWLDTLLATSRVGGQLGSVGTTVAAWCHLVVDQRLKRCLTTVAEQCSSILPSISPEDALGLDDRHAAGGEMEQSGRQFITAASTTEQPSVQDVDQRVGNKVLAGYSALLTQADRACLQYYTQCQHALIELADKSAAYEAALGHQRLMQRKIADQEEEVKSLREAYDLQIRLLSDQLTAVADDVEPEHRREDDERVPRSSSSRRGHKDT